jgi:hypothetical protein
VYVEVARGIRDWVTTCKFKFKLQVRRAQVLASESTTDNMAHSRLTIWPKSLLLMLNVPDPPPSTLIPSVDPCDLRSNVVIHQLQVVTVRVVSACGHQ